MDSPATAINDHVVIDGYGPVIGRVASPSGKEATADQFYFWVGRDQVVENTQIVRTVSQIGHEEYIFYSVVEQVFRVSRQKDIGESVDINDGDAESEPPFNSDGVTYALARVLRTIPEVFTPPVDRSRVYLCNEYDARLSYGADENEAPLSVGRIKNGGSATLGAGQIDLNYLLGANGGHMNINGVAGRGTKSSFLLFTLYMLLHEAERQRLEENSRIDRLRIVPIILNVKAWDLMLIDQPNNRFNPQNDLPAWNALGVDHPGPFHNVEFFAPQTPGGHGAISTRARSAVAPYSWSLSDIVERGLLLYLFSEDDADDANFSALVLDIDGWLTEETVNADGTTRRSLRQADNAPTSEDPQVDHADDVDDEAEPTVPASNRHTAAAFDPHRIPQTFNELLDWVKWISRNKLPDDWKSHYLGTWRKLARRLGKLLIESKGVLRRRDLRGNPLRVTRSDNSNPIVIDLNGLAGSASLQRFVVATIFREIVEARTGPNLVNGLVYLVALDELNRFAPRGAKDEITRLIELVASEMRSQGIILMGAQQQASKISERVFENSGIKVVGRSGSLEMGQPIWKFLTDGARKRAVNLQPGEKLIIQDTFREPMLVTVPFTPWAMNPREAGVAVQAIETHEDPDDPEIVV
jgi:uncharacterized protein